MAKERRDYDQVVASPIWPPVFGGFFPASLDDGRRYGAIATVLSRLEDEAFDELEEAADAFAWLIPPVSSLWHLVPVPASRDPRPPRFSPELIPVKFVNESGEKRTDEVPVHNPRPAAIVLYLDPSLEDEAVPIGVAIASVARALASISLSHDLFTNPDEGDWQEKEAWRKATEWGFKKEAGTYRQFVSASSG